MSRWSTLAVTWLLVSGCSYYDSRLLGASDASPQFDGPKEPTEGSAAEVEGSVESDTGTCRLAQPPDRPASADAGSSVSFVVATNMIDFADEGSMNPVDFGYDLDSRCTCNGQGQSCVRPAWASDEACDGEGGRDNQAGRLVKDLGKYVGKFGSEQWKEDIAGGKTALLFHVLDYNGEKDDSQVTLRWYVAAQYFEHMDGGVPAWDGTDRWPIRDTCLDSTQTPLSLERPRYFDRLGYVSNGKLVAQLAEGEIAFTGTFVVTFTGASITADIVRGDAGHWELQNGLISGRWTVPSLLGILAGNTDPFENKFICTDNPSYCTFKRMLCKYVDVLAEDGAESEVCDAMSLTMRFRAVPANLGEIVLQPPREPNCAPAVDPKKDTCENWVMCPDSGF